MAAAAVLALVPKRMSLWEHVADVDAIAETVFALDDENGLTPELQEQLQHALIAALAGTRQKVDRTASVLERFSTAEASAAAEAERLATRAKMFRRNRERLEAYVLATMDASKLEKLDGDTATLARRKNPGRVEILDESAVPTDYFRWPEEPPPPPPVIDKKAVAAAIKAGTEIPGARMVQTFRLVRS